MVSAQVERRKATDEVHLESEQKVVGKPPPVQSNVLKNREKKYRTIAVKPKLKTNPAPQVLSALRQLSSNDNTTTIEQETGGDPGGETISGDGVNPAMHEGRPGPDGSGEFSLKQVDQPPTPTRKIEPEFPLAARRLGIGGKVVVKFLVKADGNVARASIIEADPKEIFEESALEAVKEWQFNPGRFHGEAVATWVVLPIQFRLTR